MFTHTNQFKSEIYRLLRLIKAGNTNDWRGNLDDVELHDVLQYLLDQGLATGYSVKLGEEEDISVSGRTPRLTYEGLGMLEKSE